MTTQAPTLGKIATMVVFALSCFGLLLYLWTSFGGSVPMGPQGYRFSADFDGATQLPEQSDVRISGVGVGKVVKITDSPRGGIRAVIELEEKYAPLPRNARAVLRQKTLLGETFVELSPGDKRRGMLRDGGVLPASQVRQTVELDEVLRAFDAPTRRDLKVFLTGLADGLDGRGQEPSDATGSLEPAVSEADDLLRVLDAQQRAVTSLIQDTGTTFGALGRRSASVQGLVRATDTLLATTSARDEELKRTLKVLPTFLRETRQTLRAAESASADAAPLLRTLKPVAPLVPPTLRDTTALLPDAKALLAELPAALDAADRGLPAASRTVDAAREAMPQLHTAARDLRPVADYLGKYRAELMGTFANVAAATNDTFKHPGAKDALHYLRVMIPITTEAFVINKKRMGTNRTNAYRAPRGLDRLGAPGGLESFDCSHTGNTQLLPVLGTSPQGCKEQAEGFSRLERDPPYAR